MKNTWPCWPATCDCLHFNYIKNKIKWLSFNSNISSALQHLLDSAGVDISIPAGSPPDGMASQCPGEQDFPNSFGVCLVGCLRALSKSRRSLTLPFAYHSLHEGQGASCLPLHSPTSTGSLFKFRNSQVYQRRKTSGQMTFQSKATRMLVSQVQATQFCWLSLALHLLGHPVIFCQLGVTNKCSWLQVSVGSFLPTPTPRGTLPSRHLMQPDDIPQTSLSDVCVSSLAKLSAFI